MTDKSASDPSPFDEIDPAYEGESVGEAAELTNQQIHDELLDGMDARERERAGSRNDLEFDIFAPDEDDYRFADLEDEGSEPGEHDNTIHGPENEDHIPSEYERFWTPEESAQATGTTSKALGIELVAQTMLATPVRSGTSRDDLCRKTQANFEMLRGIAPRDVTEGMIAAQMVATHNMAMECLRRGNLTSNPPEVRDMALKNAAKFLGIFTQLTAALDKYRGKGHQKITVERVTVEAGGQAIVGNVSADARAKPDSAEPAKALSDDSAADALSRAALKPAKPAKQPVVRKRTR